MRYEEALRVLKKYNSKPNLIKHAVAVSAALRHFARLQGEDEEYWAVVGLLHDIDFERYPGEHCTRCAEILGSEGFDERFIQSVQSHAWGLCSNIEPVSFMENVLMTVDQLTGLIIACALVRPERKLSAVELRSVKKRWGEKSFAAGTNRPHILQGCERLGLDLDSVIAETLVALQGVADELGL